MKDVDFYTGFTKNLKLRFEQHNNGLIESTRYRKPFKLIFYEACLDQRDASRREKYLKTYHGKMFLKRRLKSYLTGWKANRARSKADFKNKIAICESEASETQYWLEVIVETEWLSWDQVKFGYEEWDCLLFLRLLGRSKWIICLNFRHFSSFYAL